MAERLNRGESWLLELSRPDKRRPVLVLSRPSLIPLLHTVTVAAITATLRGSPTEVELGVAESLKQTSWATKPLWHREEVGESYMQGNPEEPSLAAAALPRSGRGSYAGGGGGVGIESPIAGVVPAGLRESSTSALRFYAEARVSDEENR